MPKPKIVPRLLLALGVKSMFHGQKNELKNVSVVLIDGRKHFSEPVTVNDDHEITGHRLDALAANRRGDIYIAWLDKRDLLVAKVAGKKYTGAALYYALSTVRGKTFHKNKKIADSTCQCCRVAIAIDHKQLPVIVWRYIFADNIWDHAIVNFKQADQADKPIRLSHDNWHIEGCPYHGPAISIADGVYHVTWFNNAPQAHGLYPNNWLKAVILRIILF